MVDTRSHRPDPTCLQLYRATRFWSRLRGLHAYPSLRWHTGLWISPCNAVHTFGLDYTIDVVFLNRNRNRLRVVQRMAPGRIAVCLGAKSAVELPAGYYALYPDVLSEIERVLKDR